LTPFYISDRLETLQTNVLLTTI